MKREILFACFAALLAGPAPLVAQSFPERDLPPELRSWVPWVRDEIKDSVCPTVESASVCLWPGRLAMRLGAGGGDFRLEVFADRAQDVRLPGSAEHWPEDVREDGRPAVVVGGAGGPLVRVAAGSHSFEGRFVWTRLPDSIGVPPRLAVVEVSVLGREVPAPRRDDGIVWLHTDEEAGGTAESLRLQVFRRIQDGIPVLVETRLLLEVSGKAREIELEGALLPTSVPMAVSGDLPARIDASGHLRVQVRAGAFQVTVLARLEGQPGGVRPPAAKAPWPAREIWVFAADEQFRQVELMGLAPIDPSRAELPPEWRALPAFVAEPGGALSLKEVRRGESDPAPDRLQLHRELWLDQKGDGFTVRDRFSGALSRTWRLDLERPGELGRASVDSVEQLLTANPATSAAGLELRRGTLSMEADSRLPRHGSLPAVGWTGDVERLDATLHLPPGWSLLAAFGADSAPTAWTARWTLLGFFFVLIVALATDRLHGRGWATTALLAIALSYQERGAPVFAWLSVLAATALAAAPLKGGFRTLVALWRAASLVALVLTLVPFVRDQVRAALYPQVGDLGFAQGLAFPNTEALDELKVQRLKSLAYVNQAAPPPAPPPQQAAEVPQAAVAGAPASTVERSLAKSYNAPGRASIATNAFALEQDPRAVLQTGPGVPTWSWQTHALSWSGPVKSDQIVRVLLLSPGLNVLVTILRLALVLALALRLALARPSLPASAPAAAAPLALALLATALVPLPVRAEEAPRKELLDELRARLLRGEPCQPNCLSTTRLVLRLAESDLSFEAEVHAGDSGAWAIPGPPTVWAPREVKVDGESSSAIARLEDGFLHVRLEKGVHRVVVKGAAPRSDTLTLQLRDRPRHASAEISGWDVAGLRGDGPPDASIQLARRLRAGERAREESGQYAPWFEVTRTLTLGLTWRVKTEIRRVSPPGTPVSLKVPLIEGEGPTEADLEVKDQAAVVPFGRDQTEASWSSTLPLRDALTLKAPSGEPWSEVWHLECGIVWQCDAQGLAPLTRQSSGVLAPEFRPWPGESLLLRFHHPNAIAGQTMTLDSLRLETTPGERLTTTVLSLTARTSREGPLVLSLPKGAEVQEASVDGVVRPGKPEGDTLRLTLPAGTPRATITWREPRGVGIYHRLPVVGLPTGAVNVETILHLPTSRWLLLVRGPSWGPAVLFWSYLLFALIVAFALGLFTEEPMGLGGWLLLTLGLSQVSALSALVVAGMFLALAWRSKRRPVSSALLHDAIQVGLVLWVMAALVILYQVVSAGLVLPPDMQVAGADSSNFLLRWFVDRVTAETPHAVVVSLPLWVYRLLMFAWATWLAASLVRWAPWSWRALGEGGYWLPLRKGKGEPAGRNPEPPRGEPAGAS